jgi:hypothetical protein
MPFEAGLSRGWYKKGKAAGRGGRFSDMYDAWHWVKGKPTDAILVDFAGTGSMTLTAHLEGVKRSKLRVAA